MNPPSLTRRQSEMLVFLRDYNLRNGNCASRREAGEHFGYSEANATRIISRLRDLGLLRWDCGRYRSIKVCDDALGQFLRAAAAALHDGNMQAKWTQPLTQAFKEWKKQCLTPKTKKR